MMVVVMEAVLVLAAVWVSVEAGWALSEWGLVGVGGAFLVGLSMGSAVAYCFIFPSIFGHSKPDQNRIDKIFPLMDSPCSHSLQGTHGYECRMCCNCHDYLAAHSSCFASSFSESSYRTSIPSFPLAGMVEKDPKPPTTLQ